jgi:hypothetical protein
VGVLAQARAGGRWIEVPFDARAAFGQARAPVRGTVNGVPLRSRLAVYGGTTYLGLRRRSARPRGSRSAIAPTWSSSATTPPARSRSPPS